MLAYCVMGGYPFHARGNAATAGPVGWIIGAYTFGTLRNNGASSSLINTAFNNQISFVFGQPGPIGVPLAAYQSYQSIVDAFRSGALPGKYKAVMYDNENWPFTPVIEQQHPDMYEHMTANLLHQHNLLYVAAPAADIVRAIGVVIHNSTQDTYLKRNIAGGAARYADVIVIQAQYLQPHLAAYTNFAATAAQQARTANPNVKVYIGIATGPDGQSVTAQQLRQAYLAVRPIADGYWLNISSRNGYCPNCSAPRPDLAVDLLHDIYGVQ